MKHKSVGIVAYKTAILKLSKVSILRILDGKAFQSLAVLKTNVNMHVPWP